MSSYRGNAAQDRAKAIAAVALVHVVLGAAIVTGLNVEIVRKVAERLQTFDISIPDPPPPPPPPPPPDEPVVEIAPDGGSAAKAPALRAIRIERTE